MKASMRLAFRNWLRYHWNEGMVTFLLSRISAILISLYLFAHILVIRSLGQGEESFNRTMEFLSKPIFKFLEIGLVGTVIVHLLQGFRVIFFNLGLKSKYRNRFFIIIAIIAILLFLYCTYYLLPFQSRK